MTSSRCCRITSYDSPQRSIVPSANDSVTTSLTAMRRLRMSSPRGSLELTAMLFLPPVLYLKKIAPRSSDCAASRAAIVALPNRSLVSPGRGTYGGITRIGSGCLALSTRITSAPRHPRINVACDPKPSRVKSSTRTPASACAGAVTTRSLSLTRASAGCHEGVDRSSEFVRFVFLDEMAGTVDRHVLDVLRARDGVLEDAIPAGRRGIAVAVRRAKGFGPAAQRLQRVAVDRCAGVVAREWDQQRHLA